MFQNKKQPLFKNREIYARKKLKVIHVCFVNYFLPETSLGEAVFCSFSFFDCLVGNAYYLLAQNLFCST